MPGSVFISDSVWADSELLSLPPPFIPPRSPPRRRPSHRQPTTTAAEEGDHNPLGDLIRQVTMEATDHRESPAVVNDDDDDLVEITSARVTRPTNVLPPLILPHPGSRPSRRGAASQPNGPPRVPPLRPRQDEGVIDLTEEPDSPVEVRPPGQAAAEAPIHLPPIRTHRHPRRTNSQRLTPPRLSRSESIMLASQTSFIDLTGDDDNNNTSSNNDFAPPTLHGTNRRSNRNSQRPVLPPQDRFDEHDHLVDLELMSSHRHLSLASTFARGLGRTLADFLGAEMLNSQFASAARPPPHRRPGPGYNPHRHHHHHQHHQPPPSPRQEMAPVPPARQGFTRDTCAEPKDDEERVVVCPACNEELAYDPSGGAVAVAPGGAKKRKRAAGDHHFWAIKKCGHVYCAECFENRRPTKAAPGGVGFRAPAGKLPNQVPHDLRCAVEDCESKVANKTEWVGIFL